MQIWTKIERFVVDVFSCTSKRIPHSCTNFEWISTFRFIPFFLYRSMNSTTILGSTLLLCNICAICGNHVASDRRRTDSIGRVLLLNEIWNSGRSIGVHIAPKAQVASPLWRYLRTMRSNRWYGLLVTIDIVLYIIINRTSFVIWSYFEIWRFIWHELLCHLSFWANRSFWMELRFLNFVSWQILRKLCTS